MEIELSSDQRAFVQEAIHSGRIRKAEEAIQQAMSLWEDRERTRTEILAAVEIAEASIARGEGILISPESMQDLAQEIKAHGRSWIEQGPEPR